MKRKYSVWIVVMALIGLVGFKLFANKQKINEKNKPKELGAILIPVKADTAREIPLRLSIVKTGNLAPFKEAKVLLPTGGIIKNLRFELGDHVHASQILGTMDNHYNQLEFAKAQTKAAKLKNDLQTYQELYAGKAATKEKVNEVQESYDEAINQLDQLRKQIADASIKAPFDGIIASKSMEQGTFANAGAELATIINLSVAKVQVSLTEAEAYQVTEGQQVKITTNVYPGRFFEGKLTFINPQADAAHNYAAEIVIYNSGKTILRSGTFVYADFSKELQENILTIPRDALMESAQDASVYVIGADLHVVLTPVKTNREMKGRIEITEGLKPGDVVVTTGHINLKNGTQVQIAK